MLNLQLSSELQRHFDSLLESAIDGIIVIDQKGIMLEANSAMLEMFQYTKEEVIGFNVSILMPQPHRTAHDQYIHNYISGGKPKIIGIGREVEGLRKDGTLFPFRLAVGELKTESGLLFTGFIHDLSVEKESQQKLQEYVELMERMVDQRTAELRTINNQLQEEIKIKKQAEVAMMESQKLYEAIAVNFPNGTINVLDKDFNFLFVEGSGLKQIGYGTKDLIGKSYLNLISPQIRDEVEEKLRKVFEGEEENFEIDLKEHVFKVRAVALPNEKNEITRILLVESNITQQKKAEEEIFNSLKKEKELSELKSRFVSMASHEFRTPLSSIMSSASLVEKYVSSSEQPKREKHTERIKSNVRNLTMILNDFLSLEKLDEDKILAHFAEFDLVSFVHEAAEELVSLKKPGQSIEVQTDLKSYVLNSDKMMIQNILNNLVSNAIKYSGPNSKIWLKLEKLHGEIAISVNDNGRGISTDDQKHLFNRFYRASNAGNEQGTGLGLHIVKRYIEMLNGTISFDSELNKGSIFTIKLKQTCESNEQKEDSYY